MSHPLSPQERAEHRLASKAKYRATHRAELRVKGAAYRKKNRASIRKKSAEYYAKNRDTILAKIDPQANAARVKAYRLKDPEKTRASRRASYRKHRTAILARQAAHRAADPEKRRRQRAAYYVRHRLQIMARQKLRGDAVVRRARKRHAPVCDFTTKQWRAMQAHYDHRCVYCGKQAKGRLTQDHLTPLSKGGSHTASNIVPACWPCNSKKNAGPVLVPVQPVLLLA